jgi:SAM-dependent methyltransferase
MRPSIREFALDVSDNLPVDSPLLEIGSRPAEGQEAIADVRDLFAVDMYVGCDIQPGQNVDVVQDVHALPFRDNSIGAVVSFDTLEHVADPLRAMQEIHRVLRPGGIVAVSSVMFFPIHAHPWDFWRFTPEGFRQVLKPFETSLVLAQGWELMPETVFGVGIKGECPDLASRLPRTTILSDTWADGLAVDFGPIRMTVRELWGHALRYGVVAARQRARRLTRR